MKHPVLFWLVRWLARRLGLVQPVGPITLLGHYGHNLQMTCLITSRGNLPEYYDINIYCTDCMRNIILCRYPA